MRDEEIELKRVVSQAITRPPYSIDSKFLFLKEAEIGDPTPLFNPERIQESWIIPLFMEGLVCGVVQVSLKFEINRVSVFGSSPMDKSGWFDPHFFNQPPQQYLLEIYEQYRDLRLSDPLLTYDQSPTKWGWRIQIFENELVISNIFINPRGWYVKDIEKIRKDYEG